MDLKGLAIELGKLIAKLPSESAVRTWSCSSSC
jgi:hypothetical protein